MLVQTQTYSLQLGRSRSLATIHTPRLCDDNGPDHAWLHAISKARSGDWPSESARLVERCYVREAGNPSCYGDRLGTATAATIASRQSKPRHPYFCVSLGSRDGDKTLHLVRSDITLFPRHFVIL